MRAAESKRTSNRSGRFAESVMLRATGTKPIARASRVCVPPGRLVSVYAPFASATVSLSVPRSATRAPGSTAPDGERTTPLTRAEPRRTGPVVVAVSTVSATSRVSWIVATRCGLTSTFTEPVTAFPSPAQTLSVASPGSPHMLNRPIRIGGRPHRRRRADHPARAEADLEPLRGDQSASHRIRLVRLHHAAEEKAARVHRRPRAAVERDDTLGSGNPELDIGALPGDRQRLRRSI